MPDQETATQPMVRCPKCYGSGKGWDPDTDQAAGVCERCSGATEVPEVEVLRERVALLEVRVRHLQLFAILVSDLDRCLHGRHEGDVCGGASGCDGPSKGNPLLPAGTTVGYNLSARPIVVPERRERLDPKAWTPGGER